MSTRPRRWEIVRTDADQPWHAREIANGLITVRTENYSRKWGAQKAILSHIKSIHPGIRTWFSTGAGGVDLRVGMPGDDYATARRVEVREVDER